MTQSVSFSSSSNRLLKDKLASVGVTAGGIVVLIALLLIFFYLLYVVMPVFRGASIHQSEMQPIAVTGKALQIGVEEQNEIGYRFGADGRVSFFDLTGNNRRYNDYVAPFKVTAAASSAPSKNIYVYAGANGQALVLKPKFRVSYPNDIRVIMPEISFPLGESFIEIDPKQQGITALAFESQDEMSVIASRTTDGRGLLTFISSEENMMTEALELNAETVDIPHLPLHIDQMLITPDLHRLFIRAGNKLSSYDIRDPANVTLRSVSDVNTAGAKVTDMTLLTGASSLIIGNDNGVISQWFEVVKDGERKLTLIRTFDSGVAAKKIVVEHYRKGFVSSNADGSLTMFHTTGEARLLNEQIGQHAADALAYSPRANGLLVEQDSKLFFYRVENEHPEVTWSALWQEVWYEGYPEPAYVWQSTSASDEFEPKLSLVPISFGTIKAAFYAMLFAVPIALAGAIYTAYFMSPKMRTYVKPTVEIMEALPTVILGFLAGLWLAPLMEQHLPGVVAVILLLPLSFLLAAFIWHKLVPVSVKRSVPEGIQAGILVPVVLFIGWFSFYISPTLEMWFFGGDTRAYLTNELGINFDQRNSLVVGLAMGFAVIPTIFSIAEDAIFSVPRHLTNGSLALGATPWQTMVRVVLLTASPGIFSAIMMGLGRAVGETMIVLMATGNTPIMDWSVFQGMRTLAANIAVEMPESEVGSSHYRVLFLAAFVLFVFTFIFNSIAEFVRQRLRDKYSSL
jgi:phosphate transport system permease protein